MTFLNIHPAWLTAAGGFCIHMVFGTLYLWGNITPIVTSHLRKFEPDLTYNESVFVYIACLGSNGIFMLFSSYVQMKVGSRWCVLIGGYTVALAAFLASFSESLWSMILSEGILFGIGFGIAYTAPITCAVQWMPERKGLLTGIIIAGIGVGASFFSVVANTFANPDQTSVDESDSGTDYYPSDGAIANRVPNMYRLLAGLYCILITVGTILIQPHCDNTVETSSLEKGEIESGESTSPKEPCELNTIATTPNPLVPPNATVVRPHDLRDGRTKDNTRIQSIELVSMGAMKPRIDPRDSDLSQYEPPPPKSTTGLELEPLELIYYELAWRFCFCFVATTIGGMYMSATFKTFGEDHYSDETYISSVGYAAAVFNMLGRICWGFLGDQYGSLRVLALVNIAFGVIIMTYPASITLGQAGYALWTCCIFFCEGGNFALYPPITMQLFGYKHGGGNYGAFFVVFSLFVVIVISIISLTDESMTIAAVLLGAICMGGALILFSFPKEPVKVLDCSASPSSQSPPLSPSPSLST